ncbi:uncharacterized protein LOC144130298 [Amblyomma americanum]
MASSSAVTTDTWKGQLNFDKACTSTGAQDRCWLIADLTAWNQVLHEHECTLVEFSPGKLSLRHMPHSDVVEPSSVTARKAAFLISWLIANHGCITELSLRCIGWPNEDTPEEAAVPIRLHPPPGKGIRRLEIEMLDFDVSYRRGSYYLDHEDIEALRGIEDLFIFSCDARLEPPLVRLLENNSKSVKFFMAVNTELTRNMVDALQRLEKCQSITVRLCESYDDTYSDTDVVTGLAQGVAGVKKLKILLPGNSDCKFSGLAHAVEASVTLTTLELSMFSDWDSQMELFAALKVNTSVKRVRVEFDNLEWSCEEALAEVLSTNCSLLDLILNGTVTDGCMIRMAGALKQNTALEKLVFGVALEGVNGVIALCQALRTNKTLKKLEFPAFDASQTERVALAETLAHRDGYRRVRLPLAEPDLPILCALLPCPVSCPQELNEIPICSASEANIQHLFNALTSSCCRVETLSISIRGDPGASKMKALAKMLSVNRSIRQMCVVMHSDRGRVVQELLDALDANNSINEMVISSGSMHMETITALSHFFARNRTITAFRLSIVPMKLEQFEQVLAPGPLARVMSHGMTMNPVILEFGGDSGYKLSRTYYPIFEALNSNRGTLNRATDFVLLHGVDRVGAQAFQLFFGRRCLLKHVVKTSRKSEHEALLAIASAQNFLLDNYFVITGIVQRSVVCYPAGKGTQCDELNAECWRAIVRHLKVVDVLS